MTSHDPTLAVQFAIARSQAALSRGDVDTAWQHAVSGHNALKDADVHRSAVIRDLLRISGQARIAGTLQSNDHSSVIALATELIGRSVGEAGDEVYRMLNDSLFAGGAAQAASFHGLRLGSPYVPQLVADDVVCFLVVKNGMWRLAEYLGALRRAGVERFFVVDNNSADGSSQYLAEQTDITLWHTENNFSEANCGAAWFDVIARQHAVECWALMLDLDEELRVADELPIPEFCRRLHSLGFKAATGIHVDLYPRSDTDPRLHYDRFPSIEHSAPTEFEGRSATASGMRQRVFGYPVLSNKAPLQRIESGLALCGGQHFSHHHQSVIAAQTCAVLHYKFARGFIQRADAIGSDSGYHATWREQNARYVSHAEVHGEADMYDPNTSVPLGPTNDMVEQGILTALPALDSASEGSNGPERTAPPGDDSAPVAQPL